MSKWSYDFYDDPPTIEQWAIDNQSPDSPNELGSDDEEEQTA